MAVSFTPSQKGTRNAAVPLAWTSSPTRLLASDMKLLVKNLNNVPGILLPLTSKHFLDELYPWSFMNMWTLTLHIFLVIYQLLFLLSIPVWFVIHGPAIWVAAYCACVLLFNKAVCLLLNGPAYLDSDVKAAFEEHHPKERWIFLNGVAVGSHWLQANIDRLAMTFRRPIRGVHNPTAGIVFDLIQCLIERNFSYSTSDVRESYVQIKNALLDNKYDKTVLLLHSQGGIQGSLIVDWLLSEVPQTLLSQLEIYTFGNAANHFNNPHWDLRTYLTGATTETQKDRTVKSIGHIEHYGHSGDFVARWGILNFAKVPNRYMGRMFERPGSGHLLNQHYLNAMFPLDDEGRVMETNKFMEMAVNIANHETGENPQSQSTNGATNINHETEIKDQTGMPSVMTSIAGWPKYTNGVHASPITSNREGMLESLIEHITPDSGRKDSLIHDINSPVQKVASRPSQTLRVKDFSRLWQYRNGSTPPIEAQELKEEAAKRLRTM